MRRFPLIILSHPTTIAHDFENARQRTTAGQRDEVLLVDAVAIPSRAHLVVTLIVVAQVLIAPIINAATGPGSMGVLATPAVLPLTQPRHENGHPPVLARSIPPVLVRSLSPFLVSLTIPAQVVDAVQVQAVAAFPALDVVLYSGRITA